MSQPFSEYKAIRALNATSIKAGAESMKAMHWAIAGPGRKETKALVMGSAFHLAVLEPGEWANVLIFSGKSRNSKAYKEMVEANPKALILSEDEHAVIQRAADYLTGCPDVQELLAGTDREVSLTWDDADIGHKCKCRIDAVRGGDEPTVIELKSARELGENCRIFKQQSYKLHYPEQLAFYGRGYRMNYYKPPQIKVLAVQLEPYPDHSILPSHPMEMAAMEDKCIRIAREYLECEKAGFFPGVGNAPYDVPSWYPGMDEIPDGWTMEEAEV